MWWECTVASKSIEFDFYIGFQSIMIILLFSKMYNIYKYQEDVQLQENIRKQD